MAVAALKSELNNLPQSADLLCLELPIHLYLTYSLLIVAVVGLQGEERLTDLAREGAEAGAGSVRAVARQKLTHNRILQLEIAAIARRSLGQVGNSRSLPNTDRILRYSCLLIDGHIFNLIQLVKYVLFIGVIEGLDRLIARAGQLQTGNGLYRLVQILLGNSAETGRVLSALHRQRVLTKIDVNFATLVHIHQLYRVIVDLFLALVEHGGLLL